METVVARHSVRFYGRALVISLVAGVGCHLLGASNGASVAVVLLLGSGPTVYRFLQKALDQAEVLRIDSTGILDRRLKIGTIPWPQVVHVRRFGMRLFVVVRNPEILGLSESVWTRMNHPMGVPFDATGVFVSLAGLDVPAERIVEAVERGRSELQGIT